MIPLHKKSYSYLWQLKFSSGTFILLVDATAVRVKLSCGEFNWMAMIWKGTRVLIKGLKVRSHQTRTTRINRAICAKFNAWTFWVYLLHSREKFASFAQEICLILCSEIHYTDANSRQGRGFCQAGAEDSLLSLGRVAANNSSSLTFFQARSFLFLFL